MNDKKQNTGCRCEKSACGCASVEATSCTCGQECRCERICRCGGGCGCGTKK